METREKELRNKVEENFTELQTTISLMKEKIRLILGIPIEDKPDKYDEIKEIVTDYGVQLMSLLGEIGEEAEKSVLANKTFKPEEIVAAGIGPDGKKYRLVRFADDEYNIACKGATLEEIRSKFPGYEMDPLDTFTHTFLIEEDGKLILD